MQPDNSAKSSGLHMEHNENNFGTTKPKRKRVRKSKRKKTVTSNDTIEHTESSRKSEIDRSTIAGTACTEVEEELHNVVLLENIKTHQRNPIVKVRIEDPEKFKDMKSMMSSAVIKSWVSCKNKIPKSQFIVMVTHRIGPPEFILVNKNVRSVDYRPNGYLDSFLHSKPGWEQIRKMGWNFLTSKQQQTLNEEMSLIDVFTKLSKASFTQSGLSSNVNGIPNSALAIIGRNDTASKLAEQVGQDRHPQDDVICAVSLPLSILMRNNAASRICSVIKESMDSTTVTAGHHLKTLLRLGRNTLQSTMFGADKEIEPNDYALILIIQQKKNSVVVDLPGGKRRAGETALECAYREREEEAPLPEDIENDLICDCASGSAIIKPFPQCDLTQHFCLILD